MVPPEPAATPPRPVSWSVTGGNPLSVSPVQAATGKTSARSVRTLQATTTVRMNGTDRWIPAVLSRFKQNGSHRWTEPSGLRWTQETGQIAKRESCS